jgi:hypothetical protein
MKEKKGKKSLEDVANSRSTRLKELARLVPTQQLGTSTTSISTTSFSDLPPSRFVPGTNSDYSSLNLCEQLGKYQDYCSPKQTYFMLDRDFVNLEVQDNKGQGHQKGVGWRLNIIPKDWSDIVPGEPSYGYLFVYFYNSFERDGCSTSGTGYVLDNRRVGGVCSLVIPYRKTSREYFQGSIFAVVISKISQINALNRTLAANSNGSYLSSKINDTKDINYTMLYDPTGFSEFHVRNFINDIRSKNDDNTPLIVYDPFNPLILNDDFINLSCLPNAVFNINDQIIPRYSFKVNQNTFLPESEAKKLTFDDIKLKGGWHGFLTVEAELNYNYGNPTIEFKQTGSSTITFRNRYFEDTENISGNPEGPRFYGPKYFTLKINVTVIPPP